VPEGFGCIQFYVWKVADVREEWRTEASPANPPTTAKFGAKKKEATTFLGRTVLPFRRQSDAPVRQNVWYPSKTLWDFTAAYRGEAWAITGGFLPRKFDDGADGEEEDDPTDYLPDAKRQKVESEEEKQVREAMASLSYDSTCTDFFKKVANLLDREEADFDDVLKSLRRRRISTVGALAKVTDAQYMTTHLPSELPGPAKRNLSNLIRQHLEVIPKPVIRIELDDDDD
jgi:hypothetical protein